MPDTAPLRPSIAHIKVAAQRAAQLTAQMLAYSGRAHRTVEDHDLNTLVEEMRTLLETAVSKSVCLEVDLARPLPGVRADSAQLQQVVMNLVVNASEALGEEGGVVSIRTSATGDDYGEGVRDADGHDVAPGRYIVLEVSDSGAGIDEETQARIFEPFFSTKFIGRGLGLAATHGIVRGHGGTILLDSTPSEGSSFKVLLPALDRVVVPGTVSVDAPAGWKGSGTALVIDDEEIVRVVAGRALESLGLDVVTACDGLEGVEVLRERQHEITCVLLDLKMPRMDGREAFEHLAAVALAEVALVFGQFRQSVAVGFAALQPLGHAILGDAAGEGGYAGLAEVLLGHDVSGYLRPTIRHHDVFLQEHYGTIGISDLRASGHKVKLLVRVLRHRGEPSRNCHPHSSVGPLRAGIARCF